MSKLENAIVLAVVVAVFTFFLPAMLIELFLRGIRET